MCDEQYTEEESVKIWQKLNSFDNNWHGWLTFKHFNVKTRCDELYTEEECADILTLTYALYININNKHFTMYNIHQIGVTTSTLKENVRYGQSFS